MFPADDAQAVISDRRLGRRVQIQLKPAGSWTALSSPFALELTADRWNVQIEQFLKCMLLLSLTLTSVL